MKNQRGKEEKKMMKEHKQSFIPMVVPSISNFEKRALFSSNMQSFIFEVTVHFVRLS